jgi:hypothetical protein
MMRTTTWHCRYSCTLPGVGVADRDSLILVGEVADDTFGENIKRPP